MFQLRPKEIHIRQKKTPNLIAAAAAETCFSAPADRLRPLSPANGSVESKDANALKRRVGTDVEQTIGGEALILDSGSGSRGVQQQQKTGSTKKRLRRRRYVNWERCVHFHRPHPVPCPDFKGKPWQAWQEIFCWLHVRVYPWAWVFYLGITMEITAQNTEGQGQMFPPSR